MLIIHAVQVLFAQLCKADVIRLRLARTASRQRLLLQSLLEPAVSVAILGRFSSSLPPKFVSGRFAAFLFPVSSDRLRGKGTP